MDAHQLETLIERKSQAEIWEDLKRKHHGDPPASLIWHFMADRRQTLNTSIRGAELAQS